MADRAFSNPGGRTIRLRNPTTHPTSLTALDRAKMTPAAVERFEHQFRIRDTKGFDLAPGELAFLEADGTLCGHTVADLLAAGLVEV